jgi:hypothetical protein
MFGYVTANAKDLDKDQKQRYGAIYCGICRQIRERSSQTARLSLSYDMAFLALLLMSLYEPEETSGNRACGLHPIKPRPWVDNAYIRYAADMNVALAYYKALDDVRDDGSKTAKLAASALQKSLPEIERLYPRQCRAMEDCIARLSQLEQEGCQNPDLPAACFGQLMGQLLVYEEDMWAPALRQMGISLGRFIYMLDAAVDYRKDKKQGKYNPFLAMDTGEDLEKWEQYLVMDMARCTEYFELLPLVQDKALLNCILYSGVWMEFERLRPRKKDAQEEQK